ncbi:hypothetical protein GCM10017771_41670 [Streptomyces capitiformicae]|uniref:Uncharacterized protein n=1 Tax=Streptomyces capitiformicae TaxID=2014920 RepID=A0A919GSA4_9ACTN|nr:hypothetical protein GCM10017771_41670 [Streptomyces capitiformicae]
MRFRAGVRTLPGGLSGPVRDVNRPVQNLHRRPRDLQPPAAGMVPEGDAVQVEVAAEGGMGGQGA